MVQKPCGSLYFTLAVSIFYGVPNFRGVIFKAYLYIIYNMYRLLIIFLFCTLNGFAQYPYEKHPVIKYKRAAIRLDQNNSQTYFKAYAYAKKYMFKFIAPAAPDGCNLFLYLDGKLIKRMAVDDQFDWPLRDGLLYIGDINGDGLKDFKIAYPNNGSGLAGSLIKKIYLFNLGKNKFQKISFVDFAWDYERDFNGDGKFELFGQSYLSYQNHAYWVYDLYSYQKGKLVNVSKTYNYPIMIQFLGSKENYKITNKVPRNQMKQFSRPLPTNYNQEDLNN